MNAMIGAQAASAPLSTENLILEEMRTFEDAVRRALPPETLSQANKLFTAIREIFYYRGYVNTPGPNAEALKKVPRIAPKKHDFSIEIDAEGEKNYINLFDYLLGYINLRRKDGYLGANQVPSQVNRWITDIALLASGRDAVLNRSKFIGVPAEIVPLRPQPAPQPALSPADQQAEEQADLLSAALRGHGVATGDTINFESFTTQQRVVERPSFEPFVMPEDDMIDFSFLEEEQTAKQIEDAREEEVFRNNLELLQKTIPSDMTDPPVAPRAAVRPDVEVPETPHLDGAEPVEVAAAATEPDDFNFDLEKELERALGQREPGVQTSSLEAVQDELTHDDVADKLYEAARTVAEANDYIEQNARPAKAAPVDDIDFELDEAAFAEAMQLSEAELTGLKEAPSAAQYKNPEDAEHPDTISARQMIENIYKRREAENIDADVNSVPTRWDAPSVEHITPKKGYVKTIAGVAGTMFLLSASRIALVSGATALGVGAMPAVALAGIAVAAGHAFYTNRREIMAEAAKGETLREKSAIIFEGVRRTFTLPKLGLIVAGAVGGTLAGQWVASNADWLIERAAFYTTATAQVAQGLIAQLPEISMPEISMPDIKMADIQWPEITMPDLPFGMDDAPATTPQHVDPSIDAEPVQGHVMSEPRIVKTIPAGPDGVPVYEDAPDTATPTVTSDIAQQPEEIKPVQPLESRFAADAFAEVATTTPDSNAVVAPSTDAQTLAQNTAEPLVVESAPVTEIAQAPESMPDVVAGEDITASAPAPLQTTTHTVAKGDRNLWRIAQEIFGVKGDATVDAVEAIIAQNPDLAANPGKLSLGQELQIPTTLDGAPRAECQWSRRAVTCTIPSP